MSHPHGEPDNSSSSEDDGPEVFVGEPQFFFRVQPGDAAPASDEPVSLSDQASGSAPLPERTIPMAVVAAVPVLLALLLGSVGGYLIGRGTNDVSVSGQVSYACALIENVQQTHRTPGDWGAILEDQAYSDVSAVSGLLGGLVAFSGDREEFREFGQLLSGLGRLDPEALTSAVEATHQACENR